MLQLAHELGTPMHARGCSDSRSLFFVCVKISSAIALRPLCAHGSGLGPESGTGSGEGVWVCVGVCVCVPVPPPLTEERPDRPRAPPPRTRRAFVASRWNT
jgi:hypothetical protein